MLDSLIEVLHAPPAQLAVLFAGCSNDTKAVAEIANSRLVNITLVSYSDHSPFSLIPCGFPTAVHVCLSESS